MHGGRNSREPQDESHHCGRISGLLALVISAEIREVFGIEISPGEQRVLIGNGKGAEAQETQVKRRNWQCRDRVVQVAHQLMEPDFLLVPLMIHPVKPCPVLQLRHPGHTYECTTPQITSDELSLGPILWAVRLTGRLYMHRGSAGGRDG